MRIETAEAERPWLTNTGEQLLRRLPPCASEEVALPLQTIPHRLLVVKVFGMGDGVLIRSIIDYLSKRHPEMKIGVLVGPSTLEVMTGGVTCRVHQYVPQHLTIRSAIQLLRELRGCKYDAILNFEQRSLAGSALLTFTGVSSRIGFVPLIKSPKGWFLTHGIRFRDHESVWQSFVRLARLIDQSIPESLLPTAPQWGGDVEGWLADWWNSHVRTNVNPVVVLHLGSHGREFSRWPVHRFVELAERLRRCNRDLIVLLTGTASEKTVIRQFLNEYRGRVVDASELGSLMRTAALLKRCALLVSNDTGIMHLGAIVGASTVGLFGPNSPRYWAPIGPRAAYVYETKVPCSPCLNLYADRWPTKCAHSETGRCMRDITVDSVIKAAQGLGGNGLLLR